MSTWKTSLVCALALGVAASCASDVDHGPKPEADPSVGLLDGKDDGLSNYYTSIVGNMIPGNKVTADIDWPDWFHGYTVTLEAGTTMEIEVDASASGPFVVYGPSHRTRWDGRPMFRWAIAGDQAEFYAGRYTTRFDLEVEETGTYLVVYGPSWEWSADYTVGVRCTAGCRRPGECFGDNECDTASGEYCGDNGARCITFPCDVNYDICKPKEANGHWCDRDAMCAIGSCDETTDTCGAGGECNEIDGCEEGFCGWGEDNTTRICKDYAQEGESCGGFVLPSARRECAPGLDCICTEATCDAPGICTAP